MWRCSGCGSTSSEVNNGNVSFPTVGQRELSACTTCASRTTWEFSGVVAARPSPNSSNSTPSSVLSEALAENERLRRELLRINKDKNHTLGQKSASCYRLPTTHEIQRLDGDALAVLLSELCDATAAVQQRLREAELCEVCLTCPRSVAFLPCRHRPVCRTCAPSLSECCTCRAMIEMKIELFQ
eukprot:PhM_4_TR3102/c0_g1_i1/m.61428